MKDSFNIYLEIQQPLLFLPLNFLNCEILASSRNVNAHCRLTNWHADFQCIIAREL